MDIEQTAARWQASTGRCSSRVTQRSKRRMSGRLTGCLRNGKSEACLATGKQVRT